MRTAHAIGIAAAAVLASAGGAVAAVVVDVQFGQSNAGFGGPTSAYTGSAVVGSAGDNWNLFTEPFSINGPFGYSAANQPLVDPDGSASPVTLSFATPDTAIHVDGAIFSGTAYDALLTSYLFADGDRNGPADGPGTVTFAGLTPNAAYRLVLYSVADKVGRSTQFTVDGVTEDVTPTGTMALVNGDDYADITALADPTGDLSVSIARGPGSDEGDLNGIQLVSVPEPTAAAALLTAAAVGTLARRRPAR